MQYRRQLQNHSYQLLNYEQPTAIKIHGIHRKEPVLDLRLRLQVRDVCLATKTIQRHVAHRDNLQNSRDLGKCSLSAQNSAQDRLHCNKLESNTRHVQKRRRKQVHHMPGRLRIRHHEFSIHARFHRRKFSPLAVGVTHGPDGALAPAGRSCRARYRHLSVNAEAGVVAPVQHTTHGTKGLHHEHTTRERQFRSYRLNKNRPRASAVFGDPRCQLSIHRCS